METSSLATLELQIGSSKKQNLDLSVQIGCKKFQFLR